MYNKLKRRLENGEQPIGIFFDTGSEYLMECTGRTGIDFVIIDNEHSPIEAETSTRLIRAAENAGVTPLCRVREISRPAILKLLDVGAQGLIIPNVHNVQQVKDIISYARYYPVGNRGFCPTRKDGWGFDDLGSVPETMAHFNAETLIIPQCETVGALESIEEIAALDGVDGIFVGPFDLSISMEMPGDFSNPVFQAALDRIIKACHRAGKKCIFFTGSAEGIAEGFARGFDGMAYSLDAAIFIEALKERVEKARQLS